MSRISELALKKAANSIRTELGTLADFPKELANTIANVYYEPPRVFRRAPGLSQAAIGS